MKTTNIVGLVAGTAVFAACIAYAVYDEHMRNAEIERQSKEFKRMLDRDLANLKYCVPKVKHDERVDKIIEDFENKTGIFTDFDEDEETTEE